MTETETFKTMTTLEKKAHPAVKAHIDMLQSIISHGQEQRQLQELGNTNGNRNCNIGFRERHFAN